MNINEMKQDRAKITKTIRDEMNKETVDKEALLKMEAEFDALSDKIVLEEKQIEREKALGADPEPKKKTNDQGSMFIKALAGDSVHISEYRNSYTLGNDEQAGYLTAPMQFVEEVIRGLDNELHVRQISNVIGGIGAAQSLGYPYRKTEAADASWTAEVTAAGEETTLDYGQRAFKPNKLARLIKMSRTLVRHAPIAEREVQKEIVMKIGQAQENAYLNGDGSAKPLGVFQSSASGISVGRDVSTGNATDAVTFDGLINAKYSIKGQYHPNLRWIAHRDFVKQVMKIKDGEGLHVWQPSVQAGQPDRLLGHEVHMSEYAPNTFTTGEYVGIIGDFRNGYYICDAESMEIQVLNELYAVSNQIGYIVDYFGDGMPVLEEAFARVKLG